MIAVALLGAVTPALPQDASVPNYPMQPIGQKYFKAGPWTVTMTTVANCASKPVAVEPLPGVNSVPVVPPGTAISLSCEVYRPAVLGSDPEHGRSAGFRHPVVIWGNGMGAIVPGSYAYLFTHLASYGFIVVRPMDPGTLNGESMISAAHWVTDQNNDPSSEYAGRVDTSAMAAVGHSQGGIGSINALIKGDGLFRTAVSIDMPFSISCPGGTCIDPARLASATKGSALFLAGSDDPIAPDKQDTDAGVNSMTAWYNSVPLPNKTKAILIGTSHHDPFGNPSCGGLPLCNNGVYGFLGYPTAWLMWQLRGSEDGRQVFRNQAGEIYQDKANWTSIVSNIE